ncbi:MATE family efflux transporter [Spiroplasma endosymbiont of Nebria brevicollis]|uniref:MATE family efflux transporter n=1 Tax=Spiroplasma endosymbiont of Nebria brevicollis TaxID=3066284 RepID=UPI00313ABDED
MDKITQTKETVNNKATKNLAKKLKRQAIFTTAKPWKAIFMMVTPTIIAIIIFSTYQIFDKWIATQWGGNNIISNYSNPSLIIPTDQALKIINIATTYAAVPSSMMVAFALLISTGTGIKYSIAYGKNKRERMSQYLGNGFLLSFIISIIFMITMYFSCQSIIEFQAGSVSGATDPAIRVIIIKEAVRFSRILILATPFLFFANFWISLLRSEGMMLWTILINVLACLVNLSLDFILVIPGKMGMEGTAYATIIAWASINLMAITIIWRSGSNIWFNLVHLKLKKAFVIGILLIGATSLLQNIAQSVLAMVTTKILNLLPPPDYHVGDSSIPVYVQLYGGIMPWLILINAPIIGITQGAQALVGYVYGTKDFNRVWQLMWRLTLLLLLLLIASFLLVVIAGQYMMHFFGVDLAMAEHFKIYIIMQFAFYPLATLHYIAVIFYQSVNRGKISLFASLQRTIIMPIICSGLGYVVAKSTADGFYFYLFIGFIDLFAAFILLPLLGYTFWKARPFIRVTKDQTTGTISKFENNSELEIVETIVLE